MSDSHPSPSTSSSTSLATPLLSPAEYARSRHGVWLSAAGLMTDELGRILLLRPSYRDDGRWLLPGGGGEPGEAPHQVCRREVLEETGLDRAPGQALAVNWLGPGDESAPAGMPFPGEVRYVFDCGTLTAHDADRIRLQQSEILEHAFVCSATAAARMLPVDARITLAALRARLGGTGTAHLNGGHYHGQPPVLARHEVHTRPRAGHQQPWRTDPIPDGLPVRQSWGWLFAPDGRAVIVIDPDDERLAMLPGGTVEEYDTSPAATLIREAEEEAQLALDTPHPLGWVHDPTGAAYGNTGPCARVRMAARITTVGPSLPDPATGRTMIRLMATPRQAAELLGHGNHGRAQAEHAARAATELWGIPPAAGHALLTEVPADGIRMPHPGQSGSAGNLFSRPGGSA